MDIEGFWFLSILIESKMLILSVELTKKTVFKARNYSKIDILGPKNVNLNYNRTIVLSI